MKLKFTLFCLLLFAGFYQAQIAEGTISENLKKTKTTTEKLKLLGKYADFFATKTFSKSISLADEGLKLAKRTHNKTWEGNFLRLKGNAWYISGKLDSAGSYYFKSLSLLKDQNSPLDLAAVYNSLGRFYRKTGDYQRALKNYDLALNLYEKFNNDEGIATIYNESGVVYEYLNDNDAAVKLYQKSLAIQQKRGDLVGQGYALEFIGGNYMLQKKYKLAEEFLERALEIRKKTNDDFALADNYSVLAHLYQEQKKYPEAEAKYLESNRISQRLGYLDLQKDNYQNLAEIYRSMGKNDLAYEHLDQFRKINDSIFTLGKAKQIEELSLKYESAEKDRLLLTEKDKVLKRNAAVIALLGFLIVGFIYYKNYQNREKVKLQKEILHQQDLAAKAVMNAEDNERKRMATQLHDGIGQLLAAANMNINAISEYKTDENNFEKILNNTSQILSEAIGDVRTLSHQIMPNMLIKNSLAEALRDLISKTTSPKLHISLKMDGLKNNLDQNIQVVMYRIIQECINNTIKHANANQVDIAVFQNEKEISASFKDNGIGFNPQKIFPKSDGLGLENIKSRIEMLKGELHIASATNEGTEITMNIPV